MNIGFPVFVQQPADQGRLLYLLLARNSVAIPELDPLDGLKVLDGLLFARRVQRDEGVNTPFLRPQEIQLRMCVPIKVALARHFL